MKKFTKKCMAALLSGAMLFGMSVSVFAEDSKTISVTDDASKVEKIWNVAENGLFNDTESFNFTLAYTDADGIGTNATAVPQYEDSDFASKVVTITDTWKTDADNGTSASSEIDYTTLFDGITFSAPGLYHFTLSENVGTNPNISYSDATYYLDVQVVWDDVVAGTLKIGGIVTKNNPDATSTEDGKVSKAAFVNSAADSERLTVSKAVAGNSANKNDEFTFTVELNAATASGTYSTSLENVTVTAGQATTFTLKHGQTFVINNLPIGAEYTIIETDAKNYDKTEVDVNNGEKTENKVAESEIVEGTNTVAYTNTDNAVTPTGIFLQYAPYVLLLGAAVLGCFVFFRRRRA